MSLPLLPVIEACESRVFPQLLGIRKICGSSFLISPGIRCFYLMGNCFGISNLTLLSLGSCYNFITSTPQAFYDRLSKVCCGYPGNAVSICLLVPVDTRRGSYALRWEGPLGDIAGLPGIRLGNPWNTASTFQMSCGEAGFWDLLLVSKMRKTWRFNRGAGTENLSAPLGGLCRSPPLACKCPANVLKWWESLTSHPRVGRWEGKLVW